MLDSIPDKIRSLIINPLLNFEVKDYKRIREFFQAEISKDKDKFFKLMLDNYEWFLDLKNKYSFEYELYTNNPETFNAYFREYHNILQEILKLAIDSDDIPDELKLGSLYDIYLESENRRGYYYDIKFYQTGESIKETKEKFQNIIQKHLRLDPRGPTYMNGIDNYPHWSSIDFRLENGTNCIFDFIENHPKIPHNHIYFTTILLKEKKRRNLWQEGKLKEIELMKDILFEIQKIKTTRIGNTYDIPEEFRKELYARSMEETFSYIHELDIRREIESRYRAIFTLASNQLYLLASIMMGTILEQLLRLYYKSTEKFSKLIDRARQDEIISRTDHDLLRMLEHIRNYIHIHVYIESNDNISKQKFEGALYHFEELTEKLKIKILSKTRD